VQLDFFFWPQKRNHSCAGNMSLANEADEKQEPIWIEAARLASPAAVPIKRLLIHAGAFNLGLVMPENIGCGTREASRREPECVSVLYSAAVESLCKTIPRQWPSSEPSRGTSLKKQRLFECLSLPASRHSVFEISSARLLV